MQVLISVPPTATALRHLPLLPDHSAYRTKERVKHTKMLSLSFAFFVCLSVSFYITVISPGMRDLISFVQRLCTTAVLGEAACPLSSLYHSTSLLLALHSSLFPLQDPRSFNSFFAILILISAKIKPPTLPGESPAKSFCSTTFPILPSSLPRLSALLFLSYIYSSGTIWFNFMKSANVI